MVKLHVGSEGYCECGQGWMVGEWVVQRLRVVVINFFSFIIIIFIILLIFKLDLRKVGSTRSNSWGPRL